MQTFFARIWANRLAKEFILMLVSAAAVQLALGLNDLLGLISTAKSWGDLLVSFKAWGGAFSFALVVTLLKQTIAWGIAKLAGSELSGPSLAAAARRYIAVFYVNGPKATLLELDGRSRLFEDHTGRGEYNEQAAGP